MIFSCFHFQRQITRQSWWKKVRVSKSKNKRQQISPLGTIRDDSLRLSVVKTNSIATIKSRSETDLCVYTIEQVYETKGKSIRKENSRNKKKNDKFNVTHNESLRTYSHKQNRVKFEGKNKNTEIQTALVQVQLEKTLTTWQFYANLYTTFPCTLLSADF